MTTDTLSLSCKPNITEAGKRRRVRSGIGGIVVAVAMAVAAVALRLPWAWRALVFVPALVAAFGFLQARRDTCVMRARQGTLEHDDFSTEPAPAEEVAASRRVAAGIQRDALLVAIGAAVLAVATALIR